MSIKILSSYTCANTDPSVSLLEMWIRLLNDLWILWSLTSRYTCLSMSREAAQMCDPYTWGVPEHHGQRLTNPGNVDSLKEGEEEMTSPIVFQVREIRKTLSAEILGHQFVKMVAFFVNFRKSSSSGLRPVISHDWSLFLHGIDASQKTTS